MELNGAPPTLEQVATLALTNYGHFTSMLVEDGRVRGLSSHMQRLVKDCRHLFDVDLDTDHVRDCVRHALAGKTDPVVVRVTIYDPVLALGSIGNEACPHVLVTTRTAGSVSSSPLRLQAAAYQREIPAVKHVGMFGALQRRRTAQREGFDDVLFLNPDGTISEIATSNIGFIRDSQVIWPRSEWLSGVTMTLINQALDEPITAKALTLSDLAGMEAAFATNAASGIRAIESVDGVSFATEHTMLRELQDLYVEIPGELV